MRQGPVQIPHTCGNTSELSLQMQNTMHAENFSALQSSVAKAEVSGSKVIPVSGPFSPGILSILLENFLEIILFVEFLGKLQWLGDRQNER
jgi:hypothetical protein